MAQYKIPYQGLTYEIPDEGQIYRQDPLQGGGQNLYVVSGGKINRMTGAGSSVPNYNDLPLFTGEISQNYTRQFGAGVVQEASQADISNLLKLIPNQVNYTQSISPTNPNASIVTDSSGRVVSPTAPATSISPINPANTPTNPNLPFQKKGSQVFSPVTTLSSLNGQKTVDENNQKLEGLQQTYQYINKDGIPQITFAGSPEEAMKNAPNIDPHSGVMLLKPPTNNPALASIINSVNQGIQSGNASPQDIQNYSNAMDTQGSIFKNISLADAAKSSGNYSEMDFLLKRVADNTKLFNEQLSQLHADQKALREKSLQLMTPGAREQELAKQVTNIKGQIDQFKIQTEEDKFNEYEGQTMGFAGGRASEIDIRAQFKLQRMATEANTLLTELGLEQDARKMQAGATDKQLTYLKDDFELQQKVQDKITAMEDDVFNAAKDLRTEAKSTLSTILNMLEGVNPNEIPAQTKSQLVSLANQSGVPLELIEQGLKTQWAQKVFDNALKTRQEDRLSQNQKDSDSGPKTEEERKFQADLLTDMKTYKSKAEYLRDLETGKAAIVARIGQGGYNTIKNEAERYFASPSSILLGQGSAEAPDFSQFTFGEVPQTGGFFSNLFR